MAITKIKDSDYSNKGIRVKNNPLGLSVSEAQRAFDELSLDVIIPAVNRMAGEIDTTVSELQNKDTTNSTAIAKNTADISTNFNYLRMTFSPRITLLYKLSNCSFDISFTLTFCS
jgi:hypothetical protein